MFLSGHYDLVRFYPQRYFKWREPKQFLTLLDQQQRSVRRWWDPPLVLSIVCAILMGLWGLARITSNEHALSFLEALLLSISLGAFLAYLKPWITTKVASEIIVFDHCIHRIRVRTRLIAFREVVAFSWGCSANCSTLILMLRSGQEVHIGVPGEVDPDNLSAFLAERVSRNRRTP